MTTTNSILNDLVETLKDGQEGFRAAATEVEAGELKKLFGEYSLQRSKFAGELLAMAHALGEPEPATTGTVAAKLHRGWMNLKSALTSKDAHAILAECERGEDSAVAEYKKALEAEGLPADVQETLRAQSIEVKAAHDRIRNLRDSLAVE